MIQFGQIIKSFACSRLGCAKGKKVNDDDGDDGKRFTTDHYRKSHKEKKS